MAIFHLQVVELNQNKENPKEIVPTYYMMTVKPAAFSGAPPDAPTPFLHVASLIKFDTYAITHGPFTTAESMLSDFFVDYSQFTRGVW